MLFAGIPAEFSFVILGGSFLLYALLWYWVDIYYESMWYELREDEINWKRGVWFRTTGIVPYNRITNLDVRQGPFMRALGISNLALQTAGTPGRRFRRFLLRLSSMQKSSGNVSGRWYAGRLHRMTVPGVKLPHPGPAFLSISKFLVNSKASGLSWRNAKKSFFVYTKSAKKNFPKKFRDIF